MVYLPPFAPLPLPSPAPFAFHGVCAADWQMHFAGRQFNCVECGDPIALPAQNSAPVHEQQCSACCCHYSIPLRGSGIGREDILYSTPTAYGELTREDFVGRLRIFDLLAAGTYPADGDGHSAHFDEDWGDWHLHW